MRGAKEGNSRRRGHTRRRLTIKDLARALSVAPATISKAPRDCTDIKRSKIIGVLVPYLRISFFAEAVRGM
jgi:DNA-binding LacI/PurR family transcriptional regulator